MTTVDTENYFAIALSDDLANGSLTPQVPDNQNGQHEDKASRKARRDQRIAEAVQRSKVEYTAENVYTERGWFLREEHRGVQKTKIDQQKLEFLTASLYYSPETSHQDLLSKILEVFEDDKPSGGLPKELLDIGIRSALKANQPSDAVRLARSGRSSWKTQWAGAACTAHDAFIAAGEFDESLIPLIMCMSIAGPQYPLLTRLSKALSVNSLLSGTNQLGLLKLKVDNLLQTREQSAIRPLSVDKSSSGTTWTEATADIDVGVLFKEIKLVDLEFGILEEMVRRMDKASRSAEEKETAERGVRQL